MKITMYELLGLVKDDKAPKEIKIGNIKLKYNEGCEDYYIYYGKGLFEYKFETSIQFLNDEVEIIEEEDKKIEKIDFGALNTQKEKNRVMKDTINKLINEINNLKEK